VYQSRGKQILEMAKKKFEEQYSRYEGIGQHQQTSEIRPAAANSVPASTAGVVLAEPASSKETSGSKCSKGYFSETFIVSNVFSRARDLR